MHIVHQQMNLIAFDLSFMKAIDGAKGGIGVDNAQVLGKHDRTTAAITTEALATIGIEIDHFKISLMIVFNEDHPIGTNTKPAIAKSGNGLKVISIKYLLTIVNHDKIVAGTLILMKLDGGHS